MTPPAVIGRFSGHITAILLTFSKCGSLVLDLNQTINFVAFRMHIKRVHKAHAHKAHKALIPVKKITTATEEICLNIFKESEESR